MKNKQSIELILAYGAPGSGKTTLLKNLGFSILNLDRNLNKNEINKEVNNFSFFLYNKLRSDNFNLNTNYKLIIDVFFFEKNNINNLIKLLPNYMSLKKLIIYDFKFDKEQCLLNDKYRVDIQHKRKLYCRNIINIFNYQELSENDFDIDNVEIIKKDCFISSIDDNNLTEF